MYSYISESLSNAYEQLVQQDGLLPIKVSDFYMEKVKEEISHIGSNGPLFLCVFPDARRIMSSSSGESRDFVEDYNHMPVSGAGYIIQKYNDRVLFLVSDCCVSHCQYCFRHYNLSNMQKAQNRGELITMVSSLKKYLLEHRDIREIILSGGDPMMLGYESLAYVLDELKDWDIRLHTRSIVYNPYLFTDRIIDLFREYRVRLVLHAVHPYEICDTVICFLNKLNYANVRMYAQFPLLRGINDNWIVIYRLLDIFDNYSIKPLSIFIPDPIKYGTSFRIEFNRLKEIIDSLNWNTPSWINSVRVVLDTPYGKVRRENVVSEEGRCITFCRNGHLIKYYDLDEGIDVPTDINVLLWKDKLEL